MVSATTSARPRLGASWEGRPAELLPRLAGRVDVLEIIPDTLIGADETINRRLLDELDRDAPDTAVTFHGVGLSLGSTDQWNEDYLRLLDELMNWRMPLWHSEHLGFTHVGGRNLGTMPPLPLTEEALALAIRRSRHVRDAYDTEFMLEHVASPLGRPADLSLASFLNTLAAETGSRLLLDLHNIECDVDNGFLDLDDFLDELDWAAVGEIHVAGGVWRDGYHLDVHSGPIAPSTARLLDQAVTRAPNLELVVYEVLASAIPTLGADTVLAQVDLVGDLIDRHVHAARR